MYIDHPALAAGTQGCSPCSVTLVHPGDGHPRRICTLFHSNIYPDSNRRAYATGAADVANDLVLIVQHKKCDRVTTCHPKLRVAFSPVDSRTVNAVQLSMWTDFLINGLPLPQATQSPITFHPSLRHRLLHLPSPLPLRLHQ